MGPAQAPQQPCSMLTRSAACSRMPALECILFTSSAGQGRGQLCGALPDNACSADLATNTIGPYNGTLPSCERSFPADQETAWLI